MILFAVADIKYNILTTPFFEKYFRKIIIADFTMKIKHSFIDQRTVASFTTLIGNNFLSFHLYTKLIQKSQLKLNPTLYNFYVFLLIIARAFLLKTASKQPYFAGIHQIQLLSKLKRYFPLTEILSRNSDDSCSVIIFKY